MKQVSSLIWLCIIVIAFFIGRFSVDSAPQAVSVKNNELVPDLEEKMNTSEVIDSELRAEIKSLPSIDNTNTPIVASLSLENPVDIVHGILSAMIGQDYSAIAKAQAIIESLSEQALADALDYLGPFANNEQYGMTLTLFVEQYAKYSPASAMNFINNNFEHGLQKSKISSSVIASWANSDPIASLDWFQNNHDTNNLWKNRYKLQIIFSGMAKFDVDLAIASLATFNDQNELLLTAIRGITSSLNTSSQFISLMEKPGVIDNERTKSSFFRSWAKKDPQGLKAWVRTIDNTSDYEYAKQHAFDVLFTKSDDFEELANWYLSNSEPEAVKEKVSNIARRWGIQDPESGLNWIDNQIDIDKSQATYEVVKSSSIRNPDFASNNLELLATTEQKVDVSRIIYHVLKRQKSEAVANEFLKSSPYKEAIEEKLQEKRSGFVGIQL